MKYIVMICLTLNIHAMMKPVSYEEAERRYLIDKEIIKNDLEKEVIKDVKAITEAMAEEGTGQTHCCCSDRVKIAWISAAVGLVSALLSAAVTLSVTMPQCKE